MAQTRNQFFVTTAVFLLIVSITLAAVVINSGILTSHPKSEPTPTPTPSALPTPTAAPTPTDSLSSDETPAPTDAPLHDSSPSPPPTPTETPIPTPSPMPTPDPSLIIFNDSFQSGNMSAWTSMDTSGVNLSVKNHLLQCQTETSTNGSWGYLYKWLDHNYSSIHWRWYVYFANLPSVDGNIIGAGGIYNSNIEQYFNPADSVCSLEAIRQSGSWYWHMSFNDEGQFRNLTSTQQVYANLWYLVELKAIQGAGNGEVRLYLNNEVTLTATGLTNNNNSGIDHVSVGGGITAAQPITWYCGGAVAAQTYVGPAEASVAPQTSSGQPIETGVLLLLAVPLICFTVHRKGIG